jgi:hypothetical protein
VCPSRGPPSYISHPKTVHQVKLKGWARCRVCDICHVYCVQTSLLGHRLVLIIDTGLASRFPCFGKRVIEQDSINGFFDVCCLCVCTLWVSLSVGARDSHCRMRRACQVGLVRFISRHSSSDIIYLSRHQRSDLAAHHMPTFQKFTTKDLFYFFWMGQGFVMGCMFCIGNGPRVVAVQKQALFRNLGDSGS